MSLNRKKPHGQNQDNYNNFRRFDPVQVVTTLNRKFKKQIRYAMHVPSKILQPTCCYKFQKYILLKVPLCLTLLKVHILDG